MKDFEGFVIQKLLDIERKVSKLEIKSGIWGVFGALIGALVIVAMAAIK